MATAKLTVQRGKPNLQDVALAAGSAEAQSETISVNIDYTTLTKGEAMIMLDQIKQSLFNRPWPIQ